MLFNSSVCVTKPGSWSILSASWSFQKHPDRWQVVLCLTKYCQCVADITAFARGNCLLWPQPYFLATQSCCIVVNALLCITVMVVEAAKSAFDSLSYSKFFLPICRIKFTVIGLDDPQWGFQLLLCNWMSKQMDLLQRIKLNWTVLQLRKDQWMGK